MKLAYQRNSFQKWADHYARAFCFYVEFIGNRVKLWRSDGAAFDCHTVAEVQRICAEHRDYKGNL